MRHAASLAIAVLAFSARAVAADAGEPAVPSPAPEPASTQQPAAPAVPPTPGDLQTPENVSTRYSAYTLPRGTWSFDVGALGIGGGDVFANIGAGYGIGGGFQVEMNLAHVGVGLANATVGWHFIDTRYFDLGAHVGIWYARGQWFWLAQGAARKLISKIDALSVPLELTASVPVARWLELDLGAYYGYSKVFGSFDDSSSLFVKADLAVNQVFLRPVTRVFVSDRTALEVSAKLPLYSGIPLERRTVTVPFKRTWAFEAGVRSRLTRVLFGNIRLHYGSITDALYGARLYPSFDVEIRF